MVENQVPVYKRIWAFIEHASVIHWLWQLAVAFVFAWRGTKLMPPGLSQPEMWTETGAMFFGSLAITATAVRVVSWSAPKVKRWRAPHSLVVVSHDGSFAAVEFTHYGEPAIWEARIRIAKTLENCVNPDPLSRRCWLRRDGKSFRSLPLANGQSGSITIAEIDASEWRSGSWVSVKNAEDGGTRVPDKGVLIELELSATPPMKEGTLRRCFQLARLYRNMKELELIDVSCD